ncbi:2037_t:CDS:2, partial [Cetraspora pellucida]
LAEISTANVSSVHPVMQGGFGIGWINDTIFFSNSCNFVSFDERLGLLTVNDSTYELFNYFNTSNIKQKL